jgi:hypothetical protein
MATKMAYHLNTRAGIQICNGSQNGYQNGYQNDLLFQYWTNKQIAFEYGSAPDFKWSKPPGFQITI